MSLKSNGDASNTHAEPADSTDASSYGRPEPRRVLIVSDDTGDGRDVIGTALHQALGRLWPKAAVQWVDVLEEVGHGRGPLLRWVHSTDVRGRPRASKRVLGAVSGRRIGPVVDRAAPDMILSTSPIATTGLEWLRRRRGLGVPTAAWNFEGDADRFEDDLRLLHECAAPTPPRALRPEDALFMHVHTTVVPQQVGTVLVFEPATGVATPDRSDVVKLISGVPGITGHLRPATLLRRARWVPDREVELAALIDEIELEPGTGDGDSALPGPADLDTAVDEFFSVPLDPARACGQALLVTGLPDGGRAVLVKLHHALGDGITVLRALLSGTDGAHRSWATPPVPLVGHGPRPRLARLARGLSNLARAGTAPAAPTAMPVSSATRHYQRLLLPGDALKHAARAMDVSTSELLHALFAEAAHRTFGSGEDAPDELRVMVPWSLRGTGSLRAAGNSAGVVSADVPVGPLPPRERVRRVAAALRECADGGMPDTAGAVVRSFGFLPPPLHRLASRLVYRAKWFNAIGTVLPGPRWDVRVRGVRLSAAYPVLPLAPGVGLTWGAMTWGEHVALCVTVSEDLAGHAGTLAAAVREAFDEFSAADSPSQHRQQEEQPEWPHERRT